jgi:hypothetical protein
MSLMTHSTVYVIESTNPKLAGLSGAIRSQVEFLYEVVSIT